MLIDELNRQLKEGKNVIDIQGSIVPIPILPGVEAYGFIKITNFTGQPISIGTVINTGMEARICANLSGAGVMNSDGSYPEIYKIDNCHLNEGLHEHIEGEKLKIAEKTLGEIILRFFTKILERLHQLKNP